MNHPETQFLHERNPSLHSSREVEDVANYLRAAGDHIPNNPADKIAAHLGFLANRDYVNDGILTGDSQSIDRQIEANVVKAANVPESYFELQRRIAREQGHGDITITPGMREQMVEAVQADQRAGLGKWVEYLGGNDGGYPDWFKYYAFDSVTKLGNYDKEKGEFLKRSRGTTAAYPDLNREALSYVYDRLNKARVALTESPIELKHRQLLAKGSFGELYAHAMLKATPASAENLRETKGSWTKYDQSNDPAEANKLAASLQGHGTGWCTAGESTAAMQLQGGDFYVYYTRDEDGKDTVPRVAVRMENDRVAEVRGINPSQELEPELVDITSERLKDLPGGEEYTQKAQDMKRLTAIEKKITTNSEAELTSDELRFLYEMDRDIQGFGYDRDSRIHEIKAQRGQRDKPELSRLLPETVREQLEAAFDAYATVSHQLGTETLAPADFEQIFTLKDKEWRDNGVYDRLLKDLMIGRPVRYNLVATPNVEATEKQVIALAENFGKDQPFESCYVDERLNNEDGYTGRELSGNRGKDVVRLSLIPSRRDEVMSGKPVKTQVWMLKNLQFGEPNLNYRVPSVLDAVTYWYTLRARGDKLADSSAYEKTYIRHFDLSPKLVDGCPIVPSSCVHSGGDPSLGVSDATDVFSAHVAVG